MIDSLGSLVVRLPSQCPAEGKGTAIRFGMGSLEALGGYCKCSGMGCPAVFVMVIYLLWKPV